MAIIISKDGKGARKVEQSGVRDEKYLQAYVADNPDCLPLDDLKDDPRLLVIAREFPTDSGPIDVLAVDREGDIYVIETKLFKNPDKRCVIAQMLDYGAALCNRDLSGDEFVSEIDSVLARTGVGLMQRLHDLYGLTEEEAAITRDSIKSNLAEGNLKFVVLMDQLSDRLRELIRFINEKSQFSIYAVEMEFYRHEAMEFVIPKLFGAEVRKTVGSTGSGRGRRKWTEELCFAETARHLSEVEQSAIRRLYDASKQLADEVSFGTGNTRGSFNPKFLRCSERSLFTVWTDGGLTLNFGWHHGSESARAARDRLKSEVERLKLCQLPSNYADQFFDVSASEWVPRVDELIEAVKRIKEAQ